MRVAQKGQKQVSTDASALKSEKERSKSLLEQALFLLNMQVKINENDLEGEIAYLYVEVL